VRTSEKKKREQRLERARDVFRAVRRAGASGASVKELCTELDLETITVLRAITDMRDEGVAVWAVGDLEGVRFTLVQSVSPKRADADADPEEPTSA
jgi:hypothetical protein